MTDNMSLGFDTSKLRAGGEEAIKIFQNLSEEVLQFVKATEKITKLSKTEELVEQTFSAINEAGDKFVTKLRSNGTAIGAALVETNTVITRNLENRAKAIAKHQKKLADDTYKEIVDRNRTKHATVITGEQEKALGGVPVNASSGGLIGIRSAQLQIAELVRTGKVYKHTMEQMFNAIRTGTVSALGPLDRSQQQAEISLRKLIKAFNDAGTAGKRTQDIMISWQGVIRIFIVQQLHQVFGNFTNALQASALQAAEFSKKVGEVQTISQQSGKTTEGWTRALRDLSDAQGTEILKTTEAAYQALSNQIAKGGNVTTFLSSALEFARVTSSTAAESVDLLSASMNAYGDRAESVGRHQAIWNKVIDLGRVRASDLANTLGNTTSIAAPLGVKIEEVGAAIATLTTKGVRPDTSMTLLNNVMVKLLKPSEEMKKLLDTWGVSSGEVAVKTFGFVGVLQKLNEEFDKGGLGRIAELESDMRAIRGTAGLTGDAFNTMRDNVIKLKDAQGQYDKAAELTANTIQHKLGLEINKLNNLFVVDAGQRFLETNYNLIKATGGLKENIKPVVDGILNIYKGLTDLVIVVNSVTGVTQYFTGSMAKLLPMLTFGGTALYALAKASAFFAVSQTRLELALKAISPYFDVTKVKMLDKLKVQYLGMSLAINGTTASIWAQTAAFLASPIGIATAAVIGLTYAWTAYNDRQREISESGANELSRLNKINEEIVKGENKKLDAMRQKFIEYLDFQEKTLLQGVARIQQGLALVKQELDKFAFGLQEQNFDDSLFGKSTLERLPLVVQHIEELANLTTQLSFDNFGEDAKKVFEKLMGDVSELNRDLIKDFQNNVNEIKKLQDKLIENDLENKLFGKSTKQQSSILKSKISELVGAGDLENALKLADKLVSIQQKPDSKTKKGGSKAGRAEAEAIQEDIIKRLIADKTKEQETLVASKLEEQKINDALTKQLADNEAAYKRMADYTQSILTNKQKLIELEKATSEDISKSRIALDSNIDASIKTGTEIVDFLKAKQTGLFTGLEGASAEETAARKSLESSIKQLGILKLDPNATPDKILTAKALALKSLAQVENLSIEKGLHGYGFDKNTKVGTSGQTTEEVFNSLRNNLNETGLGAFDLEDSLAKKQELANQVVMLNNAQAQAYKMLEEAGGRFKGLIPEMQKPVESLNQTLRDFISQTATFKADFEALNAGRGGPPARAIGGLLGFAPGGLLRGGLGRDNKMFMGHDGEFVMSAEATSKFYPQLVSMNSGLTGMNTGGPITNVGDININTNLSGNNQQDVVDLGHRLRREIRRGTVRL